MGVGVAAGTHQQKGYEWTMVPFCTRRPAAFSLAQMASSASFTYCPTKSGTSAVNRPLASMGQGTSPESLATTPLVVHTRQSSSPNAGAWCTTPVPASSVTYPSPSTRKAVAA